MRDKEFIPYAVDLLKERKHNPSAFYANVYRDTMLELFQSGECKLFDDDLNDVTNKVLESGYKIGKWEFIGRIKQSNEGDNNE